MKKKDCDSCKKKNHCVDVMHVVECLEQQLDAALAEVERWETIWREVDLSKVERLEKQLDAALADIERLEMKIKGLIKYVDKPG